MKSKQPLILAVPKGRILDDVGPLMAEAGIEPEQEFFDETSRRLQFTTKGGEIEIIRIRSFDTATFLAFGAAHIAICGSDVLMEFDHSEIYSPVDLKVGVCRLSVAEPVEMAAKEDPMQWSHLRIATKYPNVTRRYFAARGVQAECIKLNGAMELAPQLGLCRRIVDLVSSGATLRANGLVEIETIAEVSARLAVNRAAFKTKPEQINMWVDRFREISLAS
ncbi:MAG: ATP phosphoribosyltransferase [Rhodospirillaceae bacterium]|nr:ATP phosphoribosyltransferase [Rhodospirillaceae bacterium]|tara:strand:+ start:557 stop:1219 length:663 start_codon:yes stop_codon:yes gene_type:complete